MYQQFFNFNTAPFSIAPDPHFIYMSEHHQEGLAHLMYAICHGGGFVALTGEVGTGKTTLCHCLLQQLPEHIDIALVLNPKLNAIELLATVCDELQVAYDEDKQTLKNLVDKLNNHLLATHAGGRQTVLLLDEAQNLSLDVLEQIRLLTNLETSKTKLLQIILVGQPELKLLLDKPELRQLNQRITARYHLIPLSYSETHQYIQHRLKVSGGNIQIFTHRAIKKIFKLSNGIPRLINILCDRALLGAYVLDTQFVTPKIIKKAAKEVFNSVENSANDFLKITLLGILLIGSLTLAMVFILFPKPSEKQIHLSDSSTSPIVKELPLQLPATLPDKKQTSPANTIDSKLLTYQQKIPLDKALFQLAEIWGEDITLGSGCKEIESTDSGLRCLFDKSNWKQLIALNRPVIMEFSMTGAEKNYALLVGLKNGNPIFSSNSKIAVPIEQILISWDGYYLMLWQSPIPDIKVSHPGKSSNAVVWIRKQLALNHGASISSPNSDLFDKELKNEIIKFQQQQHLITDGIVGARTFIHLQNSDPYDEAPKLKLEY